MFSSVLCPVDFSDHSIRALRHAAALAALARGRVTAVHVAHPLLVAASEAGVNVSSVTDETGRELREAVTGVINEAGSWAPAVSTAVTTGDAADDIVKYAADHAATVIVMGTHGLTGYRKLLLGSVAERVLRSAPVPVLVLPQMEEEWVTFGQDAPAFAVRRVLAPCDFSERSESDARVARQVAAMFRVPLMLLHVVEDVSGPAAWRDALDAESRRHLARAKARLDELAAKLGDDPQVETVTATGAPAEAIASTAAEHQAGLIVMGLGGSGGSLGARPGTTAYRVLATATAPVLAIGRKQAP